MFKQSQARSVALVSSVSTIISLRPLNANALFTRNALLLSLLSLTLLAHAQNKGANPEKIEKTEKVAEPPKIGAAVTPPLPETQVFTDYRIASR